MGIIKNTLQKQINNNNKQQFNDTTATIIEYNIVLNTAKIKFANPNGEGYLFRSNVPVSDTLGGVTGSGIYPGQACTITFIKNNMYSPVITGLVGTNYANKTCSDQGAYIVDATVSLCTKPEKIKPMITTWIEESNTNTIKYNNDLGDYTSTDTSEFIHEVLNTLDKYKTTEQGVTNLKTKSTIKLKENGDIDLFVSNNIGLRISPNNKTLEFYGMDFLFNGTKIEDYIIKNKSSQVIENITIPDIIKITEIQSMFNTIDNLIEGLDNTEYITLKNQYYNEINNMTSNFISNTYNKLLKISKELRGENND